MYSAERTDVARFMRRLYRQGLTTTSGGNVSMRAGDGHILLTASKFDKGELQAEHVGIMTMDGVNVTPELEPSIEVSMHLAIYRQRADVQAIVHAHPITASAFAATTRQINCCLIAESYALIGEPVYLDYALMGTAELASVVGRGIGQAACVVMANHGVLAVGKTLLQAFDRLEVLENAARQTLLARLIGNITELNSSQLAELDNLMGRKS